MDPIEEVKAKLDIVSFISPYVALKQAGRNFKGLCPFHGEKTASFVVSPERQIWHCFGCNLGGDVVSFYQRIENLEFYDALKALADRTGVKLAYREPEETKKKNNLYEINALTAKFYHYLLTKHAVGKQALAYLTEQRKLLPQTIEVFQLGFAPDKWDQLAKFLGKHKVSMQEAYQAGVIGRNNRGAFDMFRSRIMFPLHDNRGNITGFAGRLLQDQSNTAKYINTPETPIYIKGNTLYGLYQNSDTIRESHTVIVVEGEFDVLSSYQTGVKNVVAIKGTALTANQIALLKRYAQTIILALDQDKAGQAATRRSIELAQSSGLTIRIASLPFGKDVDDLAKASPLAWKNAVSQARPYYDWLMESVLKQYDLNDPFAKKKAAEELLPFLRAIDNDIVQEHYLKLLAKQLDTSVNALYKTAKKESVKKAQWLAGPKSQPMPVTSHEEVVLTYLLGLVLQSPNIAVSLKRLQQILEPNDLPMSALQRIYAAFITFDEQGKVDHKAIAANLPKELVPTYDVLMLTPIDSHLLQDEAKLEAELAKTAKDIKRLLLKEKLVTIRKAIAQANADSAKMQQLNSQFEAVKNQLKVLI